MSSTFTPRAKLGKTGRQVFRIGLGGAFLDQSSHDEAIRLIHHAIDRGVDYIDTSPMYLQGRSQRIIGEALASRSNAGRVTLATKLGYLPSSADHRNTDKLMAQFEDNRRLLGRRVNILQLHEADTSRWWSDRPGEDFRISPARDYDFSNATAWRLLTQLKADGQIDAIGVTGNEEAPMCRLLDALPVDTFLLAFNYTLLNQSARRHALPQARARQIGMIVGGALACGHLATPRPQWLTQPPPWMPTVDVPRYRALYELAAHTRLSLVELTVRFILADDRVDLLLLGPATRAELDDALDFAGRGPLDPELVRQIESLGSK